MLHRQLESTHAACVTESEPEFFTPWHKEIRLVITLLVNSTSQSSMNQVVSTHARGQLEVLNSGTNNLGREGSTTKIIQVIQGVRQAAE